MPAYGTDFDPIRFAARLLIQGVDPYPLIGPDRRYFWNFRLLYPLPAILLALPFLVVPVVVARAAFVAVGSGLLAYATTRVDWWRLLIFASAPWWSAIGVAQWSPLLLVVLYYPSLGFLLAAKPNIGLAVLAGAPDRRSFVRMVLSAAALTILAFVVLPTWFSSWLEAVRGTSHILPLIASPTGIPLLLLVLRWRRPEARMLLTLACVPQNPGLYEGIFLLAIPRSFREALLLATASWFVDPLAATLTHGGTFTDAARANAMAIALILYLPAAIMVLRRPNRAERPLASVSVSRTDFYPLQG